jgi:hypothetical protein
LGLYRTLLTPENLRFARQVGVTHIVAHINGYDGVLIPDHTQLLECAAPWHAGMAYAIGWMRGRWQTSSESRGAILSGEAGELA